MDRTRGAILGAFAADSLALGAHWEYDQQRIRNSLGEVRELLPPTLNNYHTGKKAGDQSHYGDQALLLLRCVNDTGRFSLNEFAGRWRSMMEFYAGYMDHASRDTLAKLHAGADYGHCGSDSSDFSGPARLAPLLCAHNPQDAAALQALAEDAKAQTTFTHGNPLLADIAEFFVQALHHIYLGDEIPVALDKSAAKAYSTLPAGKWLALATSRLEQGPLTSVAAFGQSCSALDAMPSVLYLAIKYAREPLEGLVQNVMAGGDSCARGLMLGTLFGARHGADWIPDSWLQTLAAGRELEVPCR